MSKEKAELAANASMWHPFSAQGGGVRMDAVQRTRRCCRTRNANHRQLKKGAKQMCLAMTRETYQQIWGDAKAVRAVVHAAAHRHPELFPPTRAQGYRLTGRLRESATLPGMRFRQLRLQSGEGDTLRPS